MRFVRGEHTYLPRYQKPKRVHRVSDPADIGHHCHALPRRNVVDADTQVLPGGAWETAADLVIEADLVMPLQRALHQRFEYLVAVLIGDAAFRDDSHDIVREPLDNFDHRSLLQRTTFSIRAGCIGSAARS